MIKKLKAVLAVSVFFLSFSVAGSTATADREVYGSTEKTAVISSTDNSENSDGYCIRAENENLRLLTDSENQRLGIENKKNGYIWWSSPENTENDPVATQLTKDELMSPVLLRYGEKRSDNNLLRKNNFKTETVNIENGIRVVYRSDFFEFPVEYTLEKDYLKVSIRTAEIKEFDTSKTAVEMTVLGNMGAGSSDEEGYFVIPDGCGALVRFNNDRTTRADAYSQMIYGNNITAVPETRGAVTKQIYFPMFATVKKDNALLSVAVKGDSDAYISSKVSGQSKSTFNLCSFTFILRNKDTYSMKGSSEKLTVFESGEIKSDDIEVRFYPLEKKDINYIDVAERYRQYLTEECGTEKRTSENYNSLYVDLYGGTLKKKSFLGLPVTSKQPLTSYSQAEKILKLLKESGVDRMNVNYRKWTDDGIKGKTDTAEKPSGKLGGRSEFKKLLQFAENNNIALYPSADSTAFRSGNGYGYMSDTAVRVSGTYAKLPVYDLAYGIPNSLKKESCLLSPSVFSELFSDTAKNCGKNGINGISAGSFCYRLYGDYGKKEVSRYRTMNIIKDGFEVLENSLQDGILAPTANAFLIPYVSHITDVPSSSGGFDIFDEDIPFFQIVMHGLVPYSSTALNGSPDFETAVLTAVSTGSYFKCDMIYSTADILKNTENENLFYADFRGRAGDIAEYYRLFDEVYRDTSDSFITDYSRDGNIVITAYSNGTVIKTDFENMTVDFNGKIIELK